MKARAVSLIARSVLIEAVRRKEVYVIALLSALLIAGVIQVRFFDVQGLNKFYREIALKIMSVAAALTTIVLAARQLPREFERRTIYPLLARPISRLTFLFGKLTGVMLAAAFCYILLMAVYIAAASIWLEPVFPWALLAQHFILQMLMLLILATLSFWLSLMLNFDAAITLGVLLYLLATVITSVMMYIYDYVGLVGRFALAVLVYVIPQLTLFDLSEKAVHADVWPPIPAWAMLALAAYALVFSALYFGLAAMWFRRRPL